MDDGNPVRMINTTDAAEADFKLPLILGSFCS